MAIEGVIFDVKGTLVSASDQALPGVIEAVERLKGLNVKVIAARNDGPANVTENLLRRAGVHFDLVVTEKEVGKAKGSHLWVEFVKKHFDLKTNQLLYVGRSERDMWTAAHAHVIYIQADWTGEQSDYGLHAPAPGWIPAVVEHIFRRKHSWYWVFEKADRRGRTVRKMTLLDSWELGKANSSIKINLINALKGRNSSNVGMMPLKEFAILYLLASLYAEGLADLDGCWTTYPGHNPGKYSPMRDSLDIMAKLFRRKYYDDLLIRSQPALNSNDAHGKGIAVENQLTTVHVNSAHARTIKNKSILIIDDFLTFGTSVEIGRNLLMAAGASDVVTVAIGKYSSQIYVTTIYDDGLQKIDPFAVTPDITGLNHKEDKDFGVIYPEALNEFLKSYDAMSKERW